MVDTNDTAKAHTVQLYGTVTDSKHEPQVSASVRIMKGDKTVSGTTTDFDGKYQFSNVVPGTYDLVVSYTAHWSERITGIVISSNPATVIRKDIVLTQGKTMGVVAPSYKRPIILRKSQAPKNVAVNSIRTGH